MPPALADSHLHLNRYAPKRVEEMLTRAREVGVVHFLTIGVDVASSFSGVELASRHEGVVAAVGVHPKQVGIGSSVDGLRDLAIKQGVVALGEVGLDDTTGAPIAVQTQYFGACLALAQEMDLALSLHVVGAHSRAQQMLASRGPLRAVIHYFQDDWPLAKSYLELGCCISVGKPVTRSERLALRDAVRRIPLDRLLLETDTYPLPGRTTEPRDVVLICQAVAELKKLSFDAVAEATTDNYLRLFGHNRGF